MLFRTVLLSALGLGAVAFAVFPARSAEMPKEGACHVKSTKEGKQTLNMIDKYERYGIGTFDEIGPTVSDCGQGQSQPAKERCFGISEITNSDVSTVAYCISTDQDGDTVVWKSSSEGSELYGGYGKGTSEVLMGSGKYEGMTGTSTWFCSYHGNPDKYTSDCESKNNYKLK